MVLKPGGPLAMGLVIVSGSRLVATSTVGIQNIRFVSARDRSLRVVTAVVTSCASGDVVPARRATRVEP